MQIKIKRLTDTAKIPTRGSEHAAGYDLYADTERKTRILPHDTVELYTGISLEIPTGYFGAVYARSGLATKHGLRPPNCVGVIDSDYRGNIGVALHNDTNETEFIEPHERIAQIVIQPHLVAEFVEDELSETERGQNGFGSTGKL